jgi:hypothetical protein
MASSAGGFMDSACSLPQGEGQRHQLETQHKGVAVSDNRRRWSRARVAALWIATAEGRPEIYLCGVPRRELKIADDWYAFAAS